MIAGNRSYDVDVDGKEYEIRYKVSCSKASTEAYGVVKWHWDIELYDLEVWEYDEASNTDENITKELSVETFDKFFEKMQNTFGGHEDDAEYTI